MSLVAAHITYFGIGAMTLRSLWSPMLLGKLRLRSGLRKLFKGFSSLGVPHLIGRGLVVTSLCSSCSCCVLTCTASPCSVGFIVIATTVL